MLKFSVEAYIHLGQTKHKDQSKRLLCSQMKLLANLLRQNQNKQEFPIHFLSGESSVQCLAIKAKTLSSLYHFTQYKTVYYI